MTKYQYLDLAVKQSDFRLLLLKLGKWGSDIMCELQHECLASAQPYEALSYVWGDPSDTRVIWLNGHPHYVTRNLYSALQHLRLEDQDRVLWVDALCINQEDLVERSLQVRSMNLIYGKAAQVVSWLGDSDQDSDEGLELIKELGSWSKENGDEFIDALATEKATALEIFERMGFSMDDRNWPAFWSIFNRPYWTRVWIIQELAASGNLEQAKGTLMCGKSSLDRKWFDYTCVIMVLIISMSKSIKTQSGIMEEPLKSMYVTGLHPPGLSMLQILAACRSAQSRSMEWLLRFSSRFESTDTRDKIYSLLGLVCDEHRAFVPDYTKPLRVVLQDLVQFLIHSSGNLNILSGNRFSDNPDGPSWTPILTQEIHNDVGLSNQDRQFAASGVHHPIVRFERDSELMIAKGSLVGKVKTIIGPARPAPHILLEPMGTQPEPERLALYKFFQDLKSFGRDLDQSKEEMFWRTLIMNQDFVVGEDAKLAPDAFRDLFRVFIGKETPPPDFLPDAPSWVRVTEFSQPYSSIMDIVATNRCFFTTECGQMGLGPCCTQTEDVVVVLLGSPVCLVLRKSDSSYMLVGDAYAHGAMQGEFVRDKTEDQFQEFILR